MQTKSTKTLIAANIFMLVVVLVMNYLANALPIAGRTPKEVSDMFPTLFTPAGFIFAIWGVIYLLLIGFVVYQARFWNKETPAFFDKIGWLFVLSCIANAAWLPAFHTLHITLAFGIILILLGSLLVIYLRLDIGKAAAFPAERWLVHLPFSVYLGWLTVASIANASILLTHLGWNGEPGGPQLWTLIMIGAAVALGVWALFARRDFGYAAVLVWALYGIHAQRVADVATEDGMVEIATLIGISLLVIVAVYRLIKSN
ncbi:MAG: hypothetical protein GC192_23980 [Bacteroidetes bacterium]|nr:hypothetical protein [Bacteroidota bacterium]